MTEQGEGPGTGSQQGRGQGDTSGYGEGGDHLTPIGPGDVLTVIRAGGFEYAYHDRDSKPPDAPVKESTGWRQTSYLQTYRLDLKVGDKLTVIGPYGGTGSPGVTSAQAQDANLGIVGDVAPITATLLDDTPGVVLVWVVPANAAAGPQTGTAWNVVAPVGSTIITDQQRTDTVPPPAGQPGQGLIAGPGIRQLADGSWVVTNADGSETHLAADGTTWIGGAPPGGWRGQGPSPYAGMTYTDQTYVDINGNETGALTALLKSRNINLPSNAGDPLLIGGAGILSLVVIIGLAWLYLRGKG